MRTKIYLLLIALVATTLSSWAASDGDTFTAGGLNYRITDAASKTVTVAIGNYSGDIIVPSNVAFSGDSYAVKSIEHYAFYNCTGLRSVVISDGIEWLGNQVFARASNLVSVTFNTTNLEIISGSSFYECSLLTEITIPEGVKRIESNAFQHCRSLVTVNLPSTLEAIGRNAFEFCESIKSFNIENGFNFKSVNGVLFSSDMAEIHAYPTASENTSFIIPNSVIRVENPVFGNVVNLTEFIVADDHSTFSAINGALFDKLGDTLICYPANKGDEIFTIPSGVKVLRAGAFYSSRNLTKIVIPASLLTINTGNTFRLCSKLVEFEVLAGNTRFRTREGVLFNSNMERLVAYPNARLGDVYDVPAETRFIGPNSFATSVNLKTINLHDDIVNIQSAAFYGSVSLENANIPNSVTTIGTFSFGNCFNLKNVTLPDGLTTITAQLFRNSTSLESIEIPAGVTSIAYQAFQYSNAKELILPDGLLTIDERAFSEMPNLTSIVIPESVTSMGDRILSGNDALKEVTFLGDPPTIGSDAFLGLAEDVTIIIPADKKDAYAQWVEDNNIPIQIENIYAAADVEVDSDEPLKFVDENGNVIEVLPGAVTDKEYTILPEDDERYEVEKVIVDGEEIERGEDGEFHIILDGNKDIQVIIVPKKIVTFEPNNGAADIIQYVKNGGLAIAPSVSNPGNDLRGWSASGITWNFTTPVTADMTLTAQWTVTPPAPATYTVTVNTSAGVTTNKPGGNPVSEGGSFSFTAEATTSGNSVSVSVDGNVISAVSGTSYQIADVRGNKTVNITLVQGGTSPTPPGEDPVIPGPGTPGGPGQVIIDENSPSELPGEFPGDGQIIIRPPLVDPNSPTPPKVIIDGKEVEGEWKTDEDGNPIFVIEFDDLEDGKHTLVINDKEFEFTVDKNARPTSNDVLSTSTVTAGYGSVTIDTPKSATVSVVSFSGSVVYNAKVIGTATVNVPAGIYAVVVDGSVTKVVVR